MDEKTVVKCEPKKVSRNTRFPQVDDATYLYVVMLANLVDVLNHGTLTDSSEQELTDEVLNAAYIVRTGAEV